MSWFRTKQQQLVDSVRDEKIFEIVAEEVSRGQIRPGLWAKAFAQAGGDEQKANAFYTELRAQQVRLGVDVTRQLIQSIERETVEEEPATLPAPTPVPQWVWISSEKHNNCGGTMNYWRLENTHHKKCDRCGAQSDWRV